MNDKIQMTNVLIPNLTFGVKTFIWNLSFDICHYKII